MVYVFGAVVVFAALFLAIASAGAREKSLGLSETFMPKSANGNMEQKVRQFAKAVAFAEGFHDRSGKILPLNVPARFHNPGDLGPGDAPGFASEFHAGSNVVMFPDDATGWERLFAKLRRIFRGESRVFSLDDSINQMASKYAADSVNWAKNVSFYLGVPATTTLRAWLGMRG